MSRGFGATFGAGTTDAIAANYSTLPTGKASYSIWININGLGGGSLGRIWDASVNTTANDSIFASAGSLSYERNYSTTLGAWVFTIPSSNVWHHILISIDHSATANDATIWVDGVKQSLSITRPVGTRVDTAQNYIIGNRISSGNRNFDGMLAHFAHWSGVLLSDAEAVMLSAGVNPLNIEPAFLKVYMPLDGVSNPEFDYFNAPAGTQTGTRLGTSNPIESLYYEEPYNFEDCITPGQAEVFRTTLSEMGTRAGSRQAY